MASPRRRARQDRRDAGMAAERGGAYARLDPARLAQHRRATAMPRSTRTTRGRNGSEGEDRVYADDAADGYDTLEWMAAQPWSNGAVGMSGSSAGATTTLCRGLAAPSERCAPSSPRPARRASMTTSSMRASRSRWSGSGCGSRTTFPGCRAPTAKRSSGGWAWCGAARRAAPVAAAALRAHSMRRAQLDPPFVGSADWMRLPLIALSRLRDLAALPRRDHRASRADEFRARHDFRRTIEIPGFHVTTWFDIFLTSVLAGVHRDRGARRQPEALDRPQQALLRLSRRNSGRATRISIGSTIG